MAVFCFLFSWEGGSTNISDTNMSPVWPIAEYNLCVNVGIWVCTCNEEYALQRCRHCS